MRLLPRRRDDRSRQDAYEETRDDETRHTHHDPDRGYDRSRDAEAVQREEYGGFNFGAAFFGWLVAVALTVLLLGIAGAVATAVGSTMDLSRDDLTAQADTTGLVGAIVLLLLLMLAYYGGGYVAGRMSRFDGGRQGAGVWVIALIAMILVAVVGALFGAQYNIFQRVSVPALPASTDQLTAGGIIAAVVLLLATLLAAVLGGKAGEHYHRKVDRAGRLP